MRAREAAPPWARRAAMRAREAAPPRARRAAMRAREAAPPWERRAATTPRRTATPRQRRAAMTPRARRAATTPRRLALLCAAAALAALAAPASAPAAQQRTITMSGASPARALVADLAVFYRRETRNAPRFSIVGGGTGIGIADAARGIVDAGLSGRALTDADPPGLVFTPLAASAICLVTNAANPLPSLTRAQIQDLVAGRLTSWSQVPGSPRSDPIVHVGFDLTSAARATFLSAFVDLETPLAYQPRTFTATAQVRNFIQVTPGAWGYLDLAFTPGLHTVDYEGTRCSATGSYPAQRQMGFVTRGRPRGALARFLRWIKRDATAKRVIRTRYVVPR